MVVELLSGTCNPSRLDRTGMGPQVQDCVLRVFMRALIGPSQMRDKVPSGLV